jgi:hypothetical protein
MADDKKTPDSGTDATAELKKLMRAQTEAPMDWLRRLVNENTGKTEEFLRRMREPLQPGSPDPKEEEKKPGLWERIRRRLGQA